MATNPPSGDGQRIGQVRERSQTHNPQNDRWVKRDTNTGRFIDTVKGNQGDLLTTLLACAGVPLDRPIGIATKEIKEMMRA